MKGLLLRARAVVRTSKMKISRRHLADYVKTAPESVPHEQHDYFSSFNQSNHLFVASSLPLLSSFLKLPTDALIHLLGLVFLLHFKTLARPTQTKCHTFAFGY